MNRIEWSKRAFKQLKQIPADYQKVIVDAVDGLKDLSTCPNVRALQNHTYDYRLRVGRYRVIFDHDSVVKIVFIQEVRKRDEHTY